MRTRIDCCYKCVPPKRNKDCHSTCKEYKDQKAELEESQKIMRSLKNTEISDYEYDKQGEHIHRNHMKNKNKGRVCKV